MRKCGFDRKIVAVTFPGRRHDHDPVDTCGVHFAPKIVLAQRYRSLRFRALVPETLRRVGAPDVDLRIDAQHWVFPILDDMDDNNTAVRARVRRAVTLLTLRNPLAGLCVPVQRVTSCDVTFPNNHALYIGNLGSAKTAARDAVGESDLVMVVGDRLSHVEVITPEKTLSEIRKWTA